MKNRSSTSPEHQLFLRILILVGAIFVVILGIFFTVAIRDKNRQTRIANAAWASANAPAPAKATLNTGNSATNLLLPLDGVETSNSK